jgi:photosystem II stability/assembly factor-like uncharacterized protein
MYRLFLHTIFLVAFLSGFRLNAQGVWTFQEVAKTHPSEWLTSIFFRNPSAGWIVGGLHGKSSIYKTDDGGKTWTPQSFESPAQLWAVEFVDDTTGWVVGSYGVIAHTNDGGNTWTIQRNGTGLERFDAIHFIDDSTGWAVGKDGIIVKTVNGGRSWEQINLGINGWLKSVQFLNQTIGWIIGYQYGNGQAIVLKTTDHGESWEVLSMSNVVLPYSVFFTNEAVG